MSAFVLITGASSGIGRATALRLAEEKKNLFLVARRKAELNAVAKEAKREGVNVETRSVDLTDEAAVTALFDELGTFSIEAVINNAGAAYGRDLLQVAEEKDLLKMVEINVTAFLRVVKRSIPLLTKTKGHLVNIGSVAGVEVYECGVTYSATKHFVHAITKGLRIDMLGSGIRVTEIAPGNVDTNFSTVRFKGDREKARKIYEGYEPLHAEDIADAIWYALSRPKHVNIQHLLIMPTAQATIGKIAKKELKTVI